MARSDGDVLDRLVGGAVLADADGVVGEGVDDLRTGRGRPAGRRRARSRRTRGTCRRRAGRPPWRAMPVMTAAMPCSRTPKWIWRPPGSSGLRTPAPSRGAGVAGEVGAAAEQARDVVDQGLEHLARRLSGGDAGRRPRTWGALPPTRACPRRRGSSRGRPGRRRTRRGASPTPRGRPGRARRPPGTSSGRRRGPRTPRRAMPMTALVAEMSSASNARPWASGSSVRVGDG